MRSSSERYDRALEEPTRQQGKLDANTGQEAGRHLKASLMRREGKEAGLEGGSEREEKKGREEELSEVALEEREG